MQNRLQSVGAFVCATVLSLSIVGCGKQEGNSSSSEAADSARTEVEQSVHNNTDPTANGRIDVTTKGSQVATYRGAKYIVSDATADQTTDDMGLQEICVVKQPEAWQEIKSIGWDRNSISYAGISMPWGEMSCRYEYANEVGAAEGMEEYSRTNEAGYFSGLDNIQHVDVDGHSVAYAYNEQSEDYVTAGIVDLEAQAMGEQDGTTGRTIMVNAFEQRADKCSFLVTVTCLVTNESEFALDGEQLLKDAYAPLEFAAKDAQVDAASFLADVTISNADNSHNAVIKRDGKYLISYTEHAVTLLEGEGVEALMLTTAYDFAPKEAQPEGVQTYEMDGKTVYAIEQTNSYEGAEEELFTSAVEAWVDTDGGTMYIRADLKDGEMIEDALKRVVEEKIDLQ